MWVGASETVSNPGPTLGVGVGIGIGVGFYERHSKPELNSFDPDSDADPHVLVSKEPSREPRSQDYYPSEQN
jgi:hypothetical protein